MLQVPESQIPGLASYIFETELCPYCHTRIPRNTSHEIKIEHLKDCVEYMEYLNIE